MNRQKLLAKYVIRKKLGPWKDLEHFLIYLILWAFVIAIIVINFSFIFGYYSDTMVSFYLLLNLDQYMYGKLIIAVGAVIIFMILYGLIRTVHLRRQNNDEKNH